MIWFNLKELEDKLRNYDIPDKVSYHYILAFLIIFSLLHTGDNTDYYSNKWWRTLNFVIGLSISIYGIRKSYYINESGDNKDFLKRLFSLAFVIGVRIFLVLFVFNVINEIITATTEISLTSLIPENPQNILIDAVLTFTFYLLMISSFNNINKKEESFSDGSRRKTQNSANTF